MERENCKIFDNLAPEYENEWVKPGAGRKKVKKTAAMFGLRKGMTVIEPGCGRGDFSPFLIERIGRKGRLLAVDASRKMAALARRALKKYVNAEVKRGCAGAMKVGRASADAVVCFNCFPHFYPKKRFIREFFRVLKPGGLLVVAHDISRKEINSIHGKFGFDMKKHSLPSTAALSGMMKNTGFKVLKKIDTDIYMIKAQKSG